MGQVTSGLRAVLSSAGVYDLFQKMLGAEKARLEFVSGYVRPNPGNRVLDIGCGTAEILNYLPAVEYFGFDVSQEYIDSARAKYGKRGSFTCAAVTTSTLATVSGFDIVLAIGILHHLDDRDATALLRLAKSALKPGGRLITIDGCYVERQSSLARLVLSRDRGQNVRFRHEYEELAHAIFEKVDSSERHDLLNIPFTHLVMECVA